jgi:predicted transcriptional regulator
MKSAAETLDGELSIKDAAAKIAASRWKSWPVMLRERVFGVVGREAIETAAKNGKAEKKLSEILDLGEFPHVHTDHSLHTALDRMGAAETELLPVVSRADVHQLLGVVTLDDVLTIYRVKGN